MTKTYYCAGAPFRCEVTDRLVILPRASHDIAKLQSVSVRYTLLLMLGPLALALFGFTVLLWRYLSTDEITLLLTLAGVALFIGSTVGTLHLESLALRDSEIGTSHLPLFRAKRVRAAIEQAMADRPHRPQTH